MEKVKIWDEISPINGVGAKEILARRDDLRRATGDIFLVLDNNDNVLEVQIGSTISANFKMRAGLSLQEIADNYMIEKEKQKVEAEKNEKALEEKVKILEEKLSSMEALFKSKGLI